MPSPPLKVWYCFVSLKNDYIEEPPLSVSLDPVKINQLRRYHRLVDRNNHYVSQLLKQKFANGKKIYYNDYGKPLCRDIWFNVSHDHQLVVGVCSENQIGIDCIHLDRNIDIANLQDCFVGNETTSLELFAKKEAVVKMIGRGLSIELNRIYCTEELIYLDDTPLDVTVWETTLSYHDSEYYVVAVVRNTSETKPRFSLELFNL